MTAMPDARFFHMARGRQSHERAPARPWILDETYWGYTVRSSRPVSPVLVVMQNGALGLGLASMVAIAALWVVNPAAEDAATLGIRLGASLILAGIAVMLLWFASRGVRPEVQIDCALGEVREVLRNNSGKPTLVARYGFDAVGGVFIARGRRRGHDSLVLRYRNTSQVMRVVTGREDQLVELRDRIGRDLMVRPRKSRPAVPPATSRLQPLAAPR